MDEELLRHVALTLVGIVFLGAGIAGFFTIDTLNSALTTAMPKITEASTETAAQVQSFQSSLGTYKIVSLLVALIGLYVAASGAYSVHLNRKKNGRSNAEYYTPPEV